MKRTGLLGLFLVALLSATSARGEGEAPPPEDPLSRLLRQALESNPGLQAQRKAVEAMLQRTAPAGALPDPMAEVEFMALSVSRPSASDALSRGISVGLSQEFPFPGKLRVREEKARREAEAARALLRAQESDVMGEVIAAAFRYALHRRLLEINGWTHEALAAAVSSALGVYASGAGSQADVLLAQTALTRNEAERKELEARREIALARLADLLGAPPDPALLDRLSLPDPTALPEWPALAADLEGRAPRILAARSGVAVEEKGVEAARKDFRPDFFVGGRYRFRDMAMDGKDYLSLQAGVSLPFLRSRRRYTPALKEALLRVESAGLEARNVRNGVLYEMSEAYQEALRDQQVHGLFREGIIPQARQAYEAALAAYGTGRADMGTLLGALSDFFAFQGQAEAARAGFWEARARMAALLGEAPPLPPSPPPSASGPGLFANPNPAMEAQKTERTDP